jgi:hypothetical protein
MAGRPFALIGVDRSGADAARLAKAMADEKLTWRSFTDHGAIAKQWNTPGTPTLYLIDHRGMIRFKWLGSPGEQAMDEAIDSLVREAEAAGVRAR